MPPEKSSVAGDAAFKPTVTQCKTIVKKPHFEAKFKRMHNLKAKYKKVAAALKPALLEIANRTAMELQSDTVDDHQGIKEVETQLKEAYDRWLASLSAQTTLKMEQVQRETEYNMWLVQQERTVVSLVNRISAQADSSSRRTRRSSMNDMCSDCVMSGRLYGRSNGSKMLLYSQVGTLCMLGS